MITLDNQKKKKLIIVLIILFGTLVVCLLGLLIGAALTNPNNAYQSNTSSTTTSKAPITYTTEETTTSEETTSSETSSVSTTSSAASTTTTPALNVYTNVDPAFTIKYPAGWTVNSTQSDWGDEQYGSSITRLNKGNYELTLQLNKTFSPTFCFYPDKPDNGQPGTTYTEYKEIVALDGKVYRRTIQPFTGMADTQILSACTQNTEGNFITGFAPMYQGLYGTAYTPEILAELDLMLANYHLGN